MHSHLVDHLLSRRQLLGAAGTVGAAVAFGSSGVASAGQGMLDVRPGGLDYSDPRDNLYAFGKIWAGYGQPVIGAFHGLMYGRVGTDRMRPLFNFEGIGILQAEIDKDRNLRIKSREVGLFTDLKNRDVLEHWDNPYTGKTVEVYHFYNPGGGGTLGVEMPKFVVPGNPDTPTLMNEGSVFPDENGRYPFLMPFEQYGDDLLLAWDYTHYHKNPVTPEGWPQSSTGPMVSPAEHFTFKVSRNELENRDLATVRMYAGFSRSSQWWPWMGMGGSGFEGGVLSGRLHSHNGLAGYDDIPRKILDYLEKNAPRYLEPIVGWPNSSPRLDTWTAYSQDVAPETAGYAWTPAADDIRPPTGKGAIKAG
jgi:hypothetical protein